MLMGIKVFPFQRGQCLNYICYLLYCKLSYSLKGLAYDGSASQRVNMNQADDLKHSSSLKWKALTVGVNKFC